MLTLVWPDIHNRIDVLDRVLKEFGWFYDEVVFLGDWFDNYGDNEYIAADTAEYIRFLIRGDGAKYCRKYHFLFGNHDLAYCFPNNEHLYCSGFTLEKAEAINKILTPADWAQFKLYVKTQGWYLSHAGVCPKSFQIPKGYTFDQWLEIACKKALELSSYNKHHFLLDAGFSRNGPAPVGGITWLDWKHEASVYPMIKQIVGHTIQLFPARYVEPICGDGEMWNIDTNNGYYGVIQDGKFTAVQVPKF